MHLSSSDMPASWTLLIVDDCAEDRNVYREYLLEDPHCVYQILEAGSAEMGFALCRQHHCDALLLDFCLPDMTGLEFLDELNQHLPGLTLPVIMLTGYGDEAIAVQAMKLGAQDYLVKHRLQAEVLQITVRNAIMQAYLQTQLRQTQERQRLITSMSLRIRQSLDLEQILQTAVTEVQQLLRCDRVMIYNASKITKICEAGLPQGCLQLSAAGTALTLEPPLSRQLQRMCAATVSACSDTPTLDTNLVTPITFHPEGGKNSLVWGWLVAHHCSRIRQWQGGDIETLSELAGQLAIAIQQSELLTQTQAALAREKQLSGLKSKIISTVSHEYRTPLSVILASSSLLLKHAHDLSGEQQQRCLNFIEDKAKHLTRLVDDMLTLEQCELDKSRFKPVSLDLLKLFTNIVAEQQLRSAEHHKLVLKFRGNYQGFSGDQGLLRLSLENLLDNALKYSPEGGMVEVFLDGDDTHVIFSVKDRGIGIPIADQSTLFQSFSRGSNVDTIPGTGLGLAIVRAGIELHGGAITLESRIGRGTKISVTLPKQPPL